MSLRNRLAALALAVGATLSLGLAAAPAATAATTTKTFDISGQARDCGSEFGNPNTSSNKCHIGWFTPYSYMKEWNGSPYGGPGQFTFSQGDPTHITVSRLDKGRRISVEGTIPNRGSSVFTVTKFDDPDFGNVEPGQKLNLVVNQSYNFVSTETTTTVYLNGHLNVTSAPTSGNGGGGLLSGLGGLFGSS